MCEFWNVHSLHCCYFVRRGGQSVCASSLIFFCLSGSDFLDASFTLSAISRNKFYVKLMVSMRNMYNCDICILHFLFQPES